jgi:hypothetical protein
VPMTHTYAGKVKAFQRADGRTKALVAALVALVASLVFMTFSVATALADGGAWCNWNLGYHGTCYSNNESDVIDALAESNNGGYTWDWMYNNANGGEADQNSCTYANCSAFVAVASDGYGYQEMENWGPSGTYSYSGSWSS